MGSDEQGTAESYHHRSDEQGTEGQDITNEFGYHNGQQAGDIDTTWG